MKKSLSSTSTPSEIRSETKARDHELKVITERINLAERHLTMLVKHFTAFSAGLESLCERGTKLATSVDHYSDEEYPSVKTSLAGVSENLATIQDYLSAQVDFIQSKVTPPLSLNVTNCKHAREYLKELSSIREKELLKRKALEKLKTKEPKNKGKITQAEQELQKLMVDASRSQKTLEEYMVEFERKRMEDVQTVFGNLFHGQMLFHAKALELYTNAFQNLTTVDIEKDIEAFQNDLHPGQTPSRLNVVKNGSQTSLHRFSSQGTLGSQTSLNRTGRTEGVSSSGIIFVMTVKVLPQATRCFDITITNGATIQQNRLMELTQHADDITFLERVQSVSNLFFEMCPDVKTNHRGKKLCAASVGT